MTYGTRYSSVESRAANKAASAGAGDETSERDRRQRQHGLLAEQRRAAASPRVKPSYAQRGELGRAFGDATRAPL